MKESFWENEQEITTITLNDDLFLMPTSLKGLEREVEETKEYLDHIEILRSKQFKKLKTLQEKYKIHMNVQQVHEYDSMIKKKGKTIIDLDEPGGGILRITLDYLLPYYPKDLKNKKDYYVALSEVYQHDLQEKLYHSRFDFPNFKGSKKVFILIIQYFKNHKIIDLDNRFHSFIFNALRSAQIIPDDRWQHLAFMEEGRIGEKEKTEIYIGDYENIKNVWDISLKK